MKTKQNLLTIWAKRTIPALALAGTAGVMFPSCEKPVDERKPYEMELRFRDGNLDSVRADFVQKFARDVACKHIYLTVANDNDYTTLSTIGIGKFHEILNESIQLAPNKISGQGDFWFMPGRANSADSIWFVQHGWTVNQKRR